MKLYVCCTKPKCPVLQRMKAFLQDWDLDGELHAVEGKRAYIAIKVPEHWSTSRSPSFVRVCLAPVVTENYSSMSDRRSSEGAKIARHSARVRLRRENMKRLVVTGREQFALTAIIAMAGPQIFGLVPIG